MHWFKLGRFIVLWNNSNGPEYWVEPYDWVVLVGEYNLTLGVV
jgi:hypothetical protein